MPRISALSKPLKKELSKIEKELDLANKEKSALDLKLADTDFYQGNQEEVAEALKRHANSLPRLTNSKAAGSKFPKSFRTSVHRAIFLKPNL